MASSTPRVVAHRGLHSEAAGGARENTLAAIAAAVDAGVTWVEVDVRVTSDGAVVLLHDDTLHRLWGDPRRVDAVTQAEVAALGGGDRRIPLLSEALAALDGTPVTLLIDMDDPALALPTAEVVAGSAAHTRTAWCGHPDAMALVRRRLPEASTWTAWSSPTPPTPGELRGVSVVNAQHLLVGRAFVDAVHAQGAEVAVWTVGEPSQAVHLAALGVDSITTDDAPSILRALAEGVVDERARAAAIALELGRHAARVTARARHEGVGDVETKTGPADHVTAVDREIERAVRNVISVQLPEHDVVGEEYGGSAVDGRPCWYVDPIDGTANLANGVPWTSFSLALVEAGRPVIGVVLDPGVGDDGDTAPTPVLAVEGRGAWRAGRRLRTTPSTGDDPLAGRMVVTELDGARAWPGLHPLLDALGERGCTLRVPGSGTATLSGVALGRGVAAMVHRYQSIDHAAAVLIVREAGGTVLDEHGEPHPHPIGGAVVVGADERAARALWEQWRDCR